jgi:predicted dienelactone hydrolase
VSTSSRTDTRGDRTLVTTLYQPDAPGALPLFVWVHGLGSTPEYVDEFLRQIAERGILVAAPRMPLTNAEVPAPDFDDYVNQPADISFLLDRLVADLPERIDAKRIAVGGHSLGAMTTVGLVADRCCGDVRIRAAVEMSGTRRPFPGGEATAHAVPTLWVHGTDDTTFPVRDSETLFEEAAGPKFIVVLRDTPHVPWRNAEAVPLVQDAVEQFLDEYLVGRPGGAEPLRGAGAGIAEYRSE